MSSWGGVERGEEAKSFCYRYFPKEAYYATDVSPGRLTMFLFKKTS